MNQNPYMIVFYMLVILSVLYLAGFDFMQLFVNELESFLRSLVI